MGLSPDHASTVRLVLNFESGAITPNFIFCLMIASLQLLPVLMTFQNLISPAWSKRFEDSEYQFIRDEDDTEVDAEHFMTSAKLSFQGYGYHHASYTLASISTSIFTIQPSCLPPMSPLPHVSQISSHCCEFPINWCLTSSSAPEEETTLGSAPATEGSQQDLKTPIHPSHFNKGSNLRQLFKDPTRHASNDPC